MSSSEKEMLMKMDSELAARHGAYASYATEHDPIARETFGDGPAEEMDRLIDRYATPTSCVLDLGCGAGFTLCRLAREVREIWGFEQQEDMFAATSQRVKVEGTENAKLVLGNNSEKADTDKLPDDAFDFGFSRRGPNLHPPLMPKLRGNATWVQEFAALPLGINEMLGRAPGMFLPRSSGCADWHIDMYAHLGMFCVSARTHFYADYFRDADHLAAYLGTACFLAGQGYEEERDREALEIYARYNATPKGIRMVGTRRIGVYRRG